MKPVRRTSIYSASYTSDRKRIRKIIVTQTPCEKAQEVYSNFTTETNNDSSSKHTPLLDSKLSQYYAQS